MLDVEAAVGLEQLKKYSKIIQYRVQKAKYYNQNLPRKEGWCLPPIIDGATYSHYTVRVPNREDVIFEYNSKGIELGELIQYSVAYLEEYSSSKSNCPYSHKASTTSINFTVSK